MIGVGIGQTKERMGARVAQHLTCQGIEAPLVSHKGKFPGADAVESQEQRYHTQPERKHVVERLQIFHAGRMAPQPAQCGEQTADAGRKQEQTTRVAHQAAAQRQQNQPAGAGDRQLAHGLDQDRRFGAVPQGHSRGPGQQTEHPVDALHRLLVLQAQESLHGDHACAKDAAKDQEETAQARERRGYVHRSLHAGRVITPTAVQTPERTRKAGQRAGHQ